MKAKFHLITKTLCVVLLVSTVVSCGASKSISYKDAEGKRLQFHQKKYKFHKNYPPCQTYYNKSSIFRPKK